ncbi:MAG TPA: CHAT domain-containing tetratricopeptide repeat protein [Pyrinomonadaceae bacterium]|nr:CHAT domain-containing tetratricopeptide repeat protein [Pyrinomonadaceae bacterium]
MMAKNTSLRLVLSLAVVLLWHTLTWQSAAQEAPKTLPVLADGRHAIKGGESHSYSIKLTAGQYLYALIEQQGIDLSVSLFKPDGSQISVSDSPNDRSGTEPALLVADVSGEHRVEVRAPNLRASAANYQIRIVALREATATDKQHAAAQRAFDEAQKLRAQPAATAKRDAIAKYEEALPLFQAAGDSYRQTLAVQAVGIAHLQLNEFRAALRRFEEALSLAQKIGDRRLEAPIETFLGGANDLLGEVAQSRQHFERAGVLARQLGDTPTQGSAFNNIGKLYNDAGDYQRALDYYLQALPLFAESPPRRAITLNNIGASYNSLGEPERALDYFQQSLEILKTGTDRSAEALTLHNIGYSYNKLAKYKEALDYYNQARAMVQKIGNRALEALTLDLLGATYTDMGQPEKALEYHQQALEIQRGIKNVRREALCLINLGHVYGVLGQPAKALDHYNQALAIFRNLNDLNSAAIALEGRARVQRQLGNLDESRKDIEESLSLIETVRARSGSQSLRASYLASREKAYEFYVDLLMDLHSQNRNADHDAEALQASERGRARSLLELLNEAPADIEHGISPDLVRREREIRHSINAKAQRQIQLTAQNGNKQEIETFNREIRALEDEYQQVQVAIRKASPAYAALTQPQPLGLKEIQQLLDPNTVLLEYSLGEKRSYLWVVSHDSLVTFQLAGNVSGIEQVAQKMYGYLTARSVVKSLETLAQRRSRIAQADKDFHEAAFGLSRLVLEPAAYELGKKRVVVVADGALQYIPFAALSLTPNYRPLILDNEVVSLPSASALAIQRQTLANRKPAPKALAVIADPVFSASDSRFKSGASTAGVSVDDTRIIEHGPPGSGTQLRIRRLPFTRTEADRILAVAPPGENLRAVDFRANRSIATSGELSNYRYVHFATHGYLDTSRAGLSAIVLSLVDETGKPQDGFLRTHDIYNLHLPAELVVLSACETGLGKDVKGEGLEGLTRGFMYAGARRVIVSLWNVNDKATAGLMQHLYVGMLRNQKTPAAALREAQIRMLRMNQWQSPYYWAGFVMQGEWR